MNQQNLYKSAIIAGVILTALAYWGLSDDEKSIAAMEEITEKSSEPTKAQPAGHKTKSAAKPQQQQTSARKTTALDCKSLLIPNNDVRSWKTAKLAYVKSVVYNQKALKTSHLVLDRFFVDSGIGLTAGRAILNGYDAKARRRPPYHQGEIAQASTEAHILAQSRIAIGDLTTLLLAHNSSELPGHSYYRGKNAPMFLFSYLLENTKSDPDKLANQLVDAGFKVKYSDLANATTTGLSISTIERLHAVSGLDADIVLSYKYNNSSLVLMAIDSQQTELAKYWLNMGSPLQPDSLDNNALDILARQADKFHPDEIDDLFVLIADTGLSPLKKANKTRLKSVISAQIFEPFEEQMQRLPAILSAAETEQAAALVNTVHTDMLTGYTQFDVQSAPQHTCFDELGQWLTAYTVKMPSRKGKYNRTKSQRKQQKPEMQQKPTELDADELMARAKKLYNNPNGPELDGELGSEHSLATKQAIEDYRKKELKALMKGFSDQMAKEAESTPNSHKAIVQEIMLQAQRGNWSEVFKMLTTLQSKQNATRTALIFSALSTDVDFGIIKKLLDDGGTLQESVISMLIANDNVNLTRQLLPYGLILNIDEMGNSSLARSVKWQALNMLNFLLKEGVPLDSDAQGFDALDHALKAFNYNSTDTSYISVLIYAGARIELSHKQIVENLKLRDFISYGRLTNEFPQLKF
jgi:hypothetical protein